MEDGPHRERLRLSALRYEHAGSLCSGRAPGRGEAPPERRPPPSPTQLNSPLTSLTGGNFFRHSRLRPRRSPCMFSSSFFTASGLLVPDMAPPGRPRAGRCSERARAEPLAPRPQATRLRPTPEPVSRGPGPFPSPAPPPPRLPLLPESRAPPAPRVRAASARSARRRGEGARHSAPLFRARVGLERRVWPTPRCVTESTPGRHAGARGGAGAWADGEPPVLASRRRGGGKLRCGRRAAGEEGG